MTGKVPWCFDPEPGLCVDCGMSVPGGDIICDQCKDAWQWFNRTGPLPLDWDVRQRGHAALQPGVQELQGQDAVQLVLPEEATDAQVRNS